MKSKCFSMLAKFVAVVLIVTAIPVYDNVEVLADEIYYGDINGDSTVNAQDSLAALRYAAKMELLSDEAFIRADVNGSTSVDAADALLILKYAAKLINRFPVENPVEDLPSGATPAPAADITYDSGTDTYTMHGVGEVYDDSKPLNGSYMLQNPFAGLDLDEDITLSDKGYPVYNNGVTIAYDVFVPEEAKDALLFKFELKNQQMMHPDDQYKMELCKSYSPVNDSYSMGTSEVFVAIAEDGTETEYTVLNNYGENVRCNPNYPAEGLYKIDTEKGTIFAIKKDADPEVEENWITISNIGSGYYEAYTVRYTEEGGEKSKIREGKVTSQLHIYASGSIEFWGDDLTGLQENPNGEDYNCSVNAAGKNKLFMWANNAPLTQSGYSKPNYEGALTPVLVSELGEWHSVVIIIANDYIQFYVDGNKLGAENYNWRGYKLPYKPFNSFAAFNKGYGPKDYWFSNNPNASRAYSKSLMEILTDPNTTLEIGGQNLSEKFSGQGAVGTPEGVQIKNLKFYAVPVADKNISANGIINENPIGHSNDKN